VEFEKINGIEYIGSMSCGHNPAIFARIVKNLAILKEVDSSDIFRWEEVSIQSIYHANQSNPIVLKMNQDGCPSS
jgi:hypothetical protein